ncbi:MAG TPA: effector-associated domain EAD1-containing protein [Kofleriaceae bacterium]|nr:effector-associated domain EAD1-containing protein [Kofleriaceae bacterium]
MMRSLWSSPAMMHVDFTRRETCDLHERLLYAYERQDAVESLLESAGIPVGDYPSRDTQRESWKAFLVQLEKSNRVNKLLQAVLKDPMSESIHGEVRAFVDGQSRRNGATSSGISISDAEAPVFLLCKTLHRHLGDGAEQISHKLVDRIARNNMISGVELFEATRFAIEYQLLTAEDLNPTLILDLAHGRLEQHLEEFRALLRSGLASNNMRRIKVKVDGHRFFSRIVEREADWQVYFEALRLLIDGDPEAGSTLCRVRTDGFIVPQFLIAGLLPRFQDDWRPIITEYEQQVGRDQSAFTSFQTSQWNTWLMWGPSIPICECNEWDGIRAFQYGYGDESNSIPIIGVADGTAKSFEHLAGAFKPPEHSVVAMFNEMTGRLR